jgi:hypothetical protein
MFVNACSGDVTLYSGFNPITFKKSPMRPDPFKTSFTRQFRQQHAAYSGTDVKQYQNLLFRTFGINQTEIGSLGTMLTPRLHDDTIMHRLLAKLINHDTPDAERLNAFIQETCAELFAQISAEPYTSPYFNHLNEVLNSFLELVEDFVMNGSQMLSNKLTDIFTDEFNQTFDSEEIRKAYDEIENKMYQIGEFFQYFHALLQKESENNENKNGVITMTQVAFYLDTIIAHTEKLISNTESTLDLLSTWETALLNREAQEIYN